MSTTQSSTIIVIIVTLYIRHTHQTLQFLQNVNRIISNVVVAIETEEKWNIYLSDSQPFEK